MQFGLTDDQELFRETTAKFLEDTCPLDVVRGVAEDEPGGFDREWWRRGAELGWISMLVSEDHGGGCISGNPLADLQLVAEEMGRLVSPGPLIPTNVVAAALSRVGTPAHQKQLAGLVSGETIATWCPDGTYLGTGGTGGTGTADGGIRAVAHGDGFVLEGTSRPVEAGAEADLILVTAPSDRGRAQFLVPAGTPGLTTVPAESLDLVRRFARLQCHQVEVAADAVVGEPGSVEDDVERQLEDAVALQCAEMVGAVDRVLHFTIEYAQDRFSFGRPLASYQALKHRFADMKMWLEASHASAEAAARAVDSGSDHAAELVSVAKSYIGDHAPFILSECVQLHGGIGVTWDHDLHLYTRRVVQDQTQFGTPRHHRERVAVAMGI
ncbi:MAG: acyl-CoA dehydrogenase family protein [Acidimicrobiales bacterium]